MIYSVVNIYSETRDEIEESKKRAQHVIVKYDEIKCDIGRENSHFSNDLAQIDFPRRPNWEGETDAVKIDIIERKRFSEYIEKVHSDHKGKGNGIMTDIISEILYIWILLSILWIP